MDLDVPQIVTINQVPTTGEPDFEDDFASEEEEIDEIIDDELLEPPSRPKANGKGKAKVTSTNPTPNLTPSPIQPSKQLQLLEPDIPPLPQRNIGETHIDQERVEKIIKAHGDIVPPSKDAIFLISLATEEFVKRLANAASIQASRESKASITQLDMSTVVEDSYVFLRETIPTPIPLSMALEKRAQKENERTLIATELIHPPSTAIGNGTATHSHKKRQPPLPKVSVSTKSKTRTSARQANGKSSTVASSSTSTPAVNSNRPKRAAAQKGRESWVRAEDDDEPAYGENYVSLHPQSDKDDADARILMDMDVVDRQRGTAPKSSFSNGNHLRPGLMKGFGPGAYGKIGGLSLSSGNRSVPSSPAGLREHWNFASETSRNMGRTIYSDRTDAEARKAAVDAEEQRRFKRARQKFEQAFMDEDDEHLSISERTAEA